jgi:hypothetical protein
MPVNTPVEISDHGVQVLLLVRLYGTVHPLFAVYGPDEQRPPVHIVEGSQIDTMNYKVVCTEVALLGEQHAFICNEQVGQPHDYIAGRYIDLFLPVLEQVSHLLGMTENIPLFYLPEAFEQDHVRGGSHNNGQQQEGGADYYDYFTR